MNKKLESIKTTLKRDIQKEWERVLFSITFFIFLVLISGFPLYHFPTTTLFFIIGYLACIIWIIQVFFQYILKKFNYNAIIRHIEEIQDFNSEKGVLYNKESFEIILDKIRGIYSMITLLKKYHHQKRELFFYSKRIISKNLLLEHIRFYYGIIKEIQSNLLHQISVHQSTLESAMSDVSNHVHGTDELNQVSELQLTRLDNQIKQFEELQKMLVKV